ncbi:Sugar diacid utilization regulator [Streptomyces sp. MP131-18]|nr:Sugar diacid utilization regulator [Streptomyces sp. MP131-18]
MQDMQVQWQAGRQDALLRELRRYVAGEAADVRQLLNWLHRQIGAHLALVADTGAVEATSDGFPPGLIAGIRAPLGRVSDGRLAALATRAGPKQVHLEALGPHAPRPVLVAVGDTPLSRDAAALASHTGSVIALVRRAREADRTAHSYQQKARQLRFAVFTALMAGDPALARRMTTGAVPQVLDARQVRIYLLHCAPGDRDRLAQTYQDPAGYHGAGLMVPCPVHPAHLICTIAEDDGTAAADERGAVLRQLVRDQPHYALGISGPHPLGATAAAYAEAGHALAVARNLPGRVADYRGRLPLARLLPRPEATAWAAAFVHPLAFAPKLTSDIVRLAVSVSRSGVARLLGISRNTVGTHIHRAETLLGLDLADVHARAALDLALTVNGPGPVPAAGGAGAVSAPGLDELLNAPPVVAWAADLLRPLGDRRGSDLLATLRAWIAAGTDARATGRALGISRNTVRARLRAAEALLNRDLLTLASGVHDVVHALRITAGPAPRG